MRYLSKLITADTDASVRVKYSLRTGRRIGSAIIHDTATGEDEVVNIKKLVTSKALGVGAEPLEFVGVAVCHTNKTAMLHKYVESVDMSFGRPCLDINGADFINMSAGSSFGFEYGAPDTKSLIVDTTNEAIKVMGPYGSVVSCSTKVCDTPKLMTLYDLLGRMCKETHRNVLSYKELILLSELRDITTIIRLQDSAEANRFFAKMYLDVVRGSV